MIEQGKGVILNMSSIASDIVGANDRFVYNATKATVLGMSKVGRGSQPFNSCAPPNQNCTSLHTLKSKWYTLRITPNKKFYPNKLILSVFIILCTPCELIMYPQGFAYPRLRTPVMSKALATDFVDKGIRVVCLCPGAVDTPSLRLVKCSNI